MNVVMQRKETVICLKLVGPQNLWICANYRNEQNEFADFIQDEPRWHSILNCTWRLCTISVSLTSNEPCRHLVCRAVLGSNIYSPIWLTSCWIDLPYSQVPFVLLRRIATLVAIVLLAWAKEVPGHPGCRLSSGLLLSLMLRGLWVRSARPGGRGRRCVETGDPERNRH